MIDRAKLKKEIKDVLTQIEKEEKTASIDLVNVPFAVRPAMETAKRQAKDALKVLREKLGGLAIQSSIVFAIEGVTPKQLEFVKAAQQENSKLNAIDGMALYRRIAMRVWPTVGPSGAFTTEQVSGVISELRDIAVDLDIIEMPSPQVPVNRIVKTEEACAYAIREVLLASVGPVMNMMYIKQNLGNAVYLGGEYKGGILPVAIVNLDKTEQEALKSTFPVIITVALDENTEINPKFVLEQFKRVKNQ